MIEVTNFDELGTFENDWLDAHYHFSFAHYYDPKKMGLGPLRVWNDDKIRPHRGFDAHPHRDMEIITYVRKGAISHRGRAARRIASLLEISASAGDATSAA